MIRRRSILGMILQTAAGILALAIPPSVSAQEAGPRPGVVAEPRPPKPPPPTDEPPPGDGGPRAFVYDTSEAIRLFEGRVADNPRDALSLARLGQCYLTDARERGEPTRFDDAEDVLRRALEIDPAFGRAEALLAAALCGRHRFLEAFEHARKAEEADPNDLNALATKGDALLELGRYIEAAEAFERLRSRAPVPEVDARLAHLAERQGRTDEAIATMTRAAEAAGQSSIDPHAIAWYRVQLGDLLFGAGRIEEAEASYAAVPEGIDAYHDATAGLSRVRAAQGRIDEAIDLGRSAVAIGPDPHMVVGLVELLRLTGRDVEADAFVSDLESRLKGRDDERRHLAMLLADEGRSLDEALELARLDYEQRQDVDAHATLAWALHANGRHVEAAERIEEALAVGTRDALLRYRAGVIFQDAGRTDRAAEELRMALGINPRFSPTRADDARQRLRLLDGGSEGPAPID